MKKSNSLPFSDIDHVAMVVSNMKATVAFYRKHLGFQIERKFGNDELGIRALVLKKNRSRIELFEYRDDKPEFAKRKRILHGNRVPKSYFEPGLRHIAFRTSKFDVAISQMKKKKINPWIQPKKGYSGDSITFFHDPNGVLLEMVSPLPGRGKKKVSKKSRMKVVR